MDNSNYEIRVINDRPEDVLNAIKGIKDSEDNTMYNNCISYLRVGEKVLYIQFGAALLSEDKDKLILLVKDGLITSEEFRKLLDNKNIPYNEITFMESMPLSQNVDKKIWFAREEGILREALRDSKEKGIDECNYYPGIHGRFELRYPSESKPVPFIRQAIKGAITLEDKIILLMSNSKKMNITPREACEIVFDEDIIIRMVAGDKSLPEKEIKQYKKEL